MATTTAVLKARVERGAALLDAEQPGWAPRIDVTTLNMSGGRTCVLGQTYGHYWTGVDALAIQGWRYGFSQLARDWMMGSIDTFHRLLPLWREAIEARKGTEAA